MISTVAKHIEQQAAELVAVRRYLHQHPEISGEEFETTRYLARKLEDAGVAYRLGPDHRGLIVDLGNRGAEQCLALRADLDALNIEDHKAVEYRSQATSVMHACGHDVHSSILLATVVTLNRLFRLQPPSHAIRAIFQPEEETAKGARRMIEFGALEGVSAIVAAHVEPQLDVGSVGMRAGVICAHADEVLVDVVGRGGHAARPAEAIDPIELAVKFVSECYRQIPRYGEERPPVVLSFTIIQGGHQHNVIPDTVKLVGSLRSIDAAKRTEAIRAMHEIAARLSAESSAELQLHMGMEVPSVMGDERVTQVVRNICRDVLSADFVHEIPEPSMGGEDFAFYSQAIPAAFIRLGCRGDETGFYPLHNCRFDVDERVLTLGTHLMTQIAMNFFDSEMANDTTDQHD